MRRILSWLPAATLLVVSSALIAGEPMPWSDSSGAGEPTIVLLHGFGGDRSTWDRVLPTLSQKHRVVRVELPGHGASPMVPEITVKEAARAVDRALERERVERALLVGHSYGALVALEEAVARPKRVSAVVALDMGSYTPQAPGQVAALESYLKDNRYTVLIHGIFQAWSQDPVESDSAVARALRLPREVLTAYLLDCWRTDLRERIRNLKTPIHMIASERTWPSSMPWERARSQFGYVTAGPTEGHRILEAGHLLMRDQPDSLSAMLLGIAERLPRR